MIKQILTTLLLLMTFSIANAQYSAKEQKAIQKSKDLYQKKKYDKAVASIKKVIDAHPYDNDLWQLRTLYEYDRYQDQLMKDLMDLLTKLSKGQSIPANKKYKYEEYKSDLQITCITASLLCDKQTLGSELLYDFFVKPDVDTAVADDAKDFYKKGSESMDNKEYSAAIKNFKKALDLQADYYKAAYNIANCYREQEDWENAAIYYKRAIKIEPRMLYPHKKLVDVKMKQKDWSGAYDACINGIICYPDVELFNSMSEICEKRGKTFNRHWMSRTSIPNMINSNQDPISSEPWSHYRSAKDKISSYTNDIGYIKRSNSLTEQKYLESYSWEHMLSKSDSQDGEFKFARKANKNGYLDCYAFISMYHIMFNRQYSHFAERNGDRIRTFFDEMLVE